MNDPAQKFRDFYVNTGVIFFNLNKMRKDDICSKIAKYVKDCKTCIFTYPDQDIINSPYEGKHIYYISNKWNDLMPYRYYSDLTEPIRFIQHYVAGKPWYKNNAKQIFKTAPEMLSKKEIDYWRYWQLTPWGKDEIATKEVK